MTALRAKRCVGAGSADRLTMYTLQKFVQGRSLRVTFLNATLKKP
jgi:hypothetical protein